MAQMNVNIRMDEELKKEFEFLLDEMGLSMTAAFNIFAKTVVREKKIPFEITAGNVVYTQTKLFEKIDDDQDSFVNELED